MGNQASLNEVKIIGNLGSDPEMRYNPSGVAVTTFSVATNRKWTDSKTGEKKEETEWFNVVTWGKIAETCNQYLTKSQRVFVSGRQHTRKWTSEDNVKHERVELIAERVIFLDKKSTESSIAENEPDF